VWPGACANVASSCLIFCEIGRKSESWQPSLRMSEIVERVEEII
jgi:hypothetical protein